MLKLDSDSLKHAYSGESSRAADAEWFGAEHVDFRFTCLMKCENTNCKEVSVACGRGDLEEHPDERMENITYEQAFYPTYFKPSPILIVIPVRCPAPVREELCAAFVGSWGEFATAANRIRVAVEKLLDALKIPKTIKNKAGKRLPITLHARIQSLPTKHEAVKTSLLAIKWLGNYGSHETDMSRDSIFDALDIFETVLTALFSEHPRRIERLVAAVNKHKGPARRRGK